MLSRSHTLDQHAESIRSSLLARIPRGYGIVELRSDTNSTMSGIPGPGRLVGSMLSFAGRRFERAVDRFAEQQLKMGPNMATLRLTSALHDIHASANASCRSDYVGTNTSAYATDQLIWVLNGYCSQCFTAYLPEVVFNLPEPAQKAIHLLVRYLNPLQPISHITLSALSIRLLVQSDLLAVPLIKHFDLLETIKFTHSVLRSQTRSHTPFEAEGELFALEAAIGALEQHITTERDTMTFLSRLSIGGPEDHSHALDKYLDCIKNSVQWDAREIACARLLTCLAGISTCGIEHPSYSTVRRLMAFVVNAQIWPEMPSYLMQRWTPVYWRAVAVHVESTVRVLRGNYRPVWTVAFSPDSTQVASGSIDSTVRIWDTKGGCQREILYDHRSFVTSVAFSPNGAHVASASYDNTVRLWDAKTHQETAIFHHHSRPVLSLAFSPDGMYIASGSWDGTIRLWGLDSGMKEPIHTSLLRAITEHVNPIAISPNGKTLVSGADDHSVRLWDVQDGRQITVFWGHTDWVRSVAVSPNGLWLVSGSDDKTVRLWDIQTGRQRRVFYGHSSWVLSVAFSPDGSCIVSGSNDDTVRVWDARNGSQVAVLRGHTDRVNSVAFSADSTHIASGSNDGTIHLWNINILMTALGSAPTTSTAGEDGVDVIWEAEFNEDSSD